MFIAAVMLGLSGCSNEAKKVCEHIGKKANLGPDAMQECISFVEPAKKCKGWSKGVDCAMNSSTMGDLRNCFRQACEKATSAVNTPP